ncbi:MAG: hypothetical protein ACJARD_001347 [Alphaproteobacteria bacterium]|jgi:hypothetical protein
MKHPYLIITIDTEEGFDWCKPFSRTGYTTESLFNHDFHMSGFYRNYNVKPISIVSYPLLNDPDCQKLLKTYHAQKRYFMGTHLHSWVTPPYDEILSNDNSFARNLPHDLLLKKLTILTDKFIEVMGYHPIYYKSGRYGISNRSYPMLENLGYEFDFTPFAKRDFKAVSGPNFTHINNTPYFSPKSKDVTVFPATADYIGSSKHNPLIKKLYNNDLLTRFKIRGICARLGLLNFIPLTPEGVSENEMKDLTRSLLKQGQTYFHLSYHSSSFTIKGNPYCQSQADIKLMSEKLKNYIHFFQEIGGNIALEESDLYTCTTDINPYIFLN